ncbi:ribonuclease E [Ralstonia holmesii]|uniref:ribonuclease E n=1 Tax=Ralstonia holmesii TaxID=3058602 RepID=UPI0028F6798C|nr:ribonuclease E [Ralstonia sp. LMG 32967]CAJ0696308.1 hypothetical protein R11007_02362 [Ralstonia sp. LMG 32967]
MESPHFIIDGHLRLPGLVRMPPPFGPPLDEALAIVGTQVSTPADPAAKTYGEAGATTRGQWRQRMTVLSIGVACTLAAALLGWQTRPHRQHRQQAAASDQTTVAVIAQPTTPGVPHENLATEQVALIETHEPEESEAVTAAVAAVAQAPDMAMDGVEVAAPVIAAASLAVTQLPVKSIRLRKLVRATEPAPRLPELEHPATPHDDESAFIELEPSPVDTAPIASGYAAPSASARIELQRHTRFTD